MMGGVLLKAKKGSSSIQKYYLISGYKLGTYSDKVYRSGFDDTDTPSNSFPEMTTNKPAGYSGRAQHVAVYFKEHIWIMGGYNDVDKQKNDIWKQNGDTTWEEIGEAPWSARNAMCAVV